MTINSKTTMTVLFLVLSSLLKAQSTQKAILAGALLDVVEGKIEKNVLIVIEGEEIVRITEGKDRKLYDEIIDLSEYTVLPGLIDCHTHLTNNWYLGETEFDVYSLPAATYGIVGTVNAQKTLEAGFTTVRDLHSYFYDDIALRDAIQKEWILGPRMYVSGPGITMTGGHAAWGNWFSPQIALKQNPGAIADGEDEIRKESRKHIKHQVDWIKVMATGGFGTQGSIPGAASYTEEEIAAVVDEARKRGVKVTAHAHGTEGILNALRAGVHSIEHGTFIDQEAIALLKEKEAFLVMDLLAAYYELIEVNIDYEDKKTGKDNKEFYELIADNFNKAYTEGVKMAFGTDAGVYPHGQNAKQFSLMKQAGMKEVDIIRTATIHAAELLGIEEQCGNLEVGKWADMIAVRGNPLEDITVLENVSFVMKNGKVFKSN